MPNTSAKDGHLLAALVLDNTVQLSGRVSTLPDGRLRLDDADVLATSDIEPTSPIEPDCYGILTIAEADVAGTSLEPVRVNISGTIETGLTLEFTRAQHKLASRYRDCHHGRQRRAGTRGIDETINRHLCALHGASTPGQGSGSTSHGNRFRRGRGTETLPRPLLSNTRQSCCVL